VLIDPSEVFRVSGTSREGSDRVDEGVARRKAAVAAPRPSRYRSTLQSSLALPEVGQLRLLPAHLGVCL
jgi:hypothetical protein